MYILGINAYHAGASAALLQNGQLVAAAEEERFRRIKYWAGFPSEAIRFCLAEAGISAYDLDHVGISRDPGANLPRKLLYALARRPSLRLVRDRLQNAAKVRDPRAALVEALELDGAALKTQFHNVEHHRAHMASAFFVSPFREAAVLSVDGMGDFSSTMWGVGRDGQLDVAGSVGFPHSLGIFYTALCQWLGFPGYGDEGKVMGLAPYGQPRFLEQMRRIVRIQRDGTFELDLDYFVHHTAGAAMTWDEGEPTVGTLFSPRLASLLGPPRQPRAPLTPREEDVAASLQAMLEEAELALLQGLQSRSGQRALCLAGGVALNSAFNGKILPATRFEEIYIQAAAGDAGTSLGAAAYIHCHILGLPRPEPLMHAATGPEYDDATIAAALAGQGLRSRQLPADELYSATAARIAAGQVVGWFQGRMEWGPRALGNRSILADPRRADMKDILNARIKRREPFRPFAPSVLLEATGDYFDQSYPDPFMLKVYAVRPERRAAIPAVTHVDGTGRLQTVDRAANPRYWGLINAFRGETGVPIVLNTSFNENEPIVCHPREAIDCFLRTRMDALAIGDYLVEKA